MKRLLVTSAILVVMAIGGYWAVMLLTAAADEGNLKRRLAGSRSLVAAIENYRIDHALYPRGFTASTLESLEPRYIRIAPLRGVSYFSDGANYALVVRPHSDGGPSAIAPIVINNGRVVSWPSDFDNETIDDHSRSLQRLRKRGDKKLGSTAPTAMAEALDTQKAPVVPRFSIVCTEHDINEDGQKDHYKLDPATAGKCEQTLNTEGKVTGGECWHEQGGERFTDTRVNCETGCEFMHHPADCNLIVK